MQEMLQRKRANKTFLLNFCSFALVLQSSKFFYGAANVLINLPIISFVVPYKRTLVNSLFAYA